MKLPAEDFSPMDEEKEGMADDKDLFHVKWMHVVR